MKRVAIYLRVSTEDQAAGHAGRLADSEDERYGLPRQESACRAYAAEMGWQVVEVYVETKSGFKLWERPTLTTVRQAFPHDKFDVLLVEALDRLSRKQQHQGLIFSEAERYGIELASATEDIDASTPTGQFLIMIKGALAEMEREKIIMRMRGGHNERLKAGKLPAMPRPKFGYRFGDAKKTFFVKDEEQADTVRLIYDLCLKGLSENAIRNELHEKGRWAAEGKHWWTAALHRILKDETYKGEFYANKWAAITTKSGGKSKALKPREEWILIPDAAPAIVTPYVWEQAQHQLELRKNTSARNNHDPYAALLRGGSIVCGNCGCNLVVANQSSRNRYTKYIHSVEGALRHGCTFVGISASVVDNPVWEQITHHLLHPERVREELKAQQQLDTLSTDIESITTHLERLKKQHQKATERYLLMDDEMASQAASVLMQNLSKQIKQGEEEAQALLARQKDAAQDQLAFASMQEALGVLKERLPRITAKQKQDLVRALDVKIRLYPKDHTPRWEGSFKLTPSTITRATISEHIALHSFCAVEYKWAFVLRESEACSPSKQAETGLCPLT